jgi:AcrR family transcriptional regulator
LTAAPVPTRSERKEHSAAATHARILDAARATLLAEGYANVSTRRVAEVADVPLSQIHYHFNSKQELILAVLASQNERLLERQTTMFGGAEPLWRQWQRACEFLEEDLESGYVRVLQELIAAGWSDPVLAASVREQLAVWFTLLTAVAEREGQRLGRLGLFAPSEVAALMGLLFLGAEAAILLGIPESEVPTRAALKKVSLVLREITDKGGRST